MYRLKQFIWAVNSIFKDIDQKLLDKYLIKDEKDIFNKLSKSEKHHSIRVCIKALNLQKDLNIKVNINKLAKVALLHDVGKISKRLNLIDKSILVILNKASKGKMERYNYIRKVDVFYNHGRKSSNILSKINKYDKEFLEAIENHHHDNIKDNIYLNILKQCDDES